MDRLEAVLVRDDSLSVREVGGETIVLTEAGEELHSLNEMGTFIWRAVDGDRSLGDILEALCAAATRYPWPAPGNAYVVKQYFVLSPTPHDNLRPARRREASP